MSTIRAAGLGTLTASNTATIVDPSTPAGGIARVGTLVNCPTVLTNTGATSYTLASNMPSWIRRVTVSFSNLTCSASTNPMVQLVASGSTVTSGYTGYCSYIGSGVGTTSFTNGFGLRAGSPGSGDTHHGSLTLYNVTGNTWSAVLAGCMYSGANYSSTGGGYIALANPLTGIILTSSGGSTTFSAGNVTVYYE